MKNTLRKTLSLFLAFTLLCSLGLTAAASETTRDSGPEVCQRFSIDAVAAMIASYYKGEQP